MPSQERSRKSNQNVKNHFIAGLCTAHKNFPLNKWDSLLPQVVITLNLLRISRLNPKLSAHALLNGPYDFNATPMAPPGSKILVQEKPALRGTWDAHFVNAWYLGPPSTIIGATTSTFRRHVENTSPTL